MILIIILAIPVSAGGEPEPEFKTIVLVFQPWFYQNESYQIVLNSIEQAAATLDGLTPGLAHEEFRIGQEPDADIAQRITADDVALVLADTRSIDHLLERYDAVGTTNQFFIDPIADYYLLGEPNLPENFVALGRDVTSELIEVQNQWGEDLFQDKSILILSNFDNEVTSNLVERFEAAGLPGPLFVPLESQSLDADGWSMLDQWSVEDGSGFLFNVRNVSTSTLVDVAYRTDGLSVLTLRPDTYQHVADSVAAWSEAVREVGSFRVFAEIARGIRSWFYRDRDSFESAGNVVYPRAGGNSDFCDDECPDDCTRNERVCEEQDDLECCSTEW